MSSENEPDSTTVSSDPAVLSSMSSSSLNRAAVGASESVCPMKTE